MQTITKQPLIKEPLSKDAKRLALSIYSTYVMQDEESYMYISLDKLYHLFELPKTHDSLERIIEIFMDLTEPIAVKDFEYKGKKHPEIILTFCNFKVIEKDGDDHMEIEINEMYLEAMKNYMLDPFLEIK